MTVIVKLTGRIRYRVDTGFMRKTVLVLQIEEYHKGYYFGPDPADINGIDVDRYVWRDARIEDILICNLASNKE